MFKIEPITTTNIISILQLLAVIAGFYFSVKTLVSTRTNIELATKNAQVQLYNNMLNQGRDLQLKFMDDVIKNEKEKTSVFIGIIIAYYASCFELRRVLSLPPSAEKMLDNDIRESMRDPTFKARFEQLRNLHSKEFGAFVDSLRGV